jgi:hypothetical protein
LVIYRNRVHSAVAFANIVFVFVEAEKVKFQVVENGFCFLGSPSFFINGRMATLLGEQGFSKQPARCHLPIFTLCRLSIKWIRIIRSNPQYH